MKHMLRRLVFSAISYSLLLINLATAQSPFGAPPPANDECSGATVISALPFTASQDTRLATPNATDPVLLCADSGGGKSVWYTYTADTTRYVKFTSAASTPATYDVAFGLYTGTCGSLVEVDCNDDINPGTIRQAEIIYEVQAGVTYILHVAEWKGGGPTGGVPTGGDLVLDVLVAGPPPPISLGPKAGLLSSGAIVSTNSFGNVPLSIIEVGEIENKFAIPELPAPDDVMPPKGPPGSNLIENKSTSSLLPPSSRPAVLTNFQGNGPTGAFPPDPIMAVGPNHLVSAVNSAFQIRDKSGNLLKSISMNSWFSSAVPGGTVSLSDPEVIYDHFSNRWIMTGGDFPDPSTGRPYHILLSVSDDNDPLGTWYNWAMLAGLGDSATGNLPDYPQLGYDSLALYITTRDFGNQFYSRVRIIEKTQLYANTAGSITWTDFWSIREPQHTTVVVDGIRPSEVRGTPGVHFLIATSPYGIGTFFSVWTIHDPIGSPYITGANTPVVQFTTPTNAEELGGGIALEGGGRAIRHRASYRDSSLWAVHSIASGTSNAFSALHYVRLNPFTNTNLEDVAMGLDTYEHIYPALMVNDSGDVMIVFTRSGTSEYPGVYLSGHRATDPPGLSSSVLVKAGITNYQLIQDPMGAQRNRWGDYMGIGLDPTDGHSFWAIGEYSAGSSSWGTWITKTQMAPVAGKSIYATPTDINFDEAEINHIGDTLTITFTNNGADTLVITSFTDPDSNFSLVDPPSLPLSVATFEVESVKVRFNPKTVGNLASTLVLNSNDTYNPALTINLSALGYQIAAAQSGTMYGGTGINYFGRLITIDPVTAVGAAIGLTGFEEVTNLKIHPITKELWGMLPFGSSTRLLRVNSSGGDAHTVMTIPYSTVEAMTFRGDTIYFGRFNGTIFRLDLSTGNIVQVASTGIKIAGLDFNPVTGELWASSQISSPQDRIYKIDLTTGATTLVGRTMLNVQTPDIAFDGAGNLFGVIGIGSQPSNLILIDTLTGGATIIGDIGIKPVQTIAIDHDAMFPVHAFRFVNDWNLFSVPVQVLSYATTSLFPTATSKAFAFQGQYVERDSVDPGYGFWLKFGSTYIKSVIGAPIDEDTVDVGIAWNLIGSVSDLVPTSSIVSIPSGIITSLYYTYDGGGYIPLDSLFPGYGHWVRASAAGQLVLNAPSNTPRTQPNGEQVVARTSKPSASISSLQHLHSLTIRDAVGHEQRLFFGDENRVSNHPSYYDLPPASPDGFDARFASHRMVEVHPAKLMHAMEFPLTIHSLGASVTISWHIEQEANVHYALVVTNRKTGRMSILEMRSNGDITVPSLALHDVKLRAYEHFTPQGFALLQNYPNPFNPTTTIRYELPTHEYVRLTVYDILGKKVATLVDGLQVAGYYAVPFDAAQLASGIYFYRLTAGKFSSIQKMTVMK